MALRLSLRYGAGNPRWFQDLPRDEQIAVLALEMIDGEARR